MSKLARRIGIAAIAVVGAMTIALAGLARADVKINDGGGATVPCQIKVKYPNGPVRAPFNKGLTAGDDYLAVADVGNGPGVNAVIASGRFDFNGVFGPPRTAYTAVYTYGNASAGGLQTSTLPDSLVASVGLYVPNGGSALMPPPADSMIAVRANRTVAGQVTLSISGGGLQVRAANSNETAIAEYRVIVYKDQATADADVNTDGFGAAFYGTVVLESGFGRGPATSLSASGGFLGGDFILQPQGGSKFTARPNGTINKVVVVPNAATAVVVAVGDPRTVSRPVPGQSPAGLALLALAMMASGLWVMRSRRRAASV